MAGIICDPANYVPLSALAYGSEGTPAVPVDGGHPLPVTAVNLAAGSAPLSGTASASGTFGPFAPDLGLPIWLTLSGSWTGNAQVLRSIDGGTTKLPLTVAGQPWASFAGNAQEVIGEEGSAAASYWLSVTLASGALAYRIAQ